MARGVAVTERDRRRSEFELALREFQLANALLADRVTDGRIAWATACAERCRRAHDVAVAFPSFQRARRAKR